MQAWIAKNVLTLGVGALVGLALGWVAGGWWGYIKGRGVGYEQAIADVRAQDNRAAQAGDAARAAVARCSASPGMRWDQVTGQCVPG